MDYERNYYVIFDLGDDLIELRKETIELFEGQSDAIYAMNALTALMEFIMNSMNRNFNDFINYLRNHPIPPVFASVLIDPVKYQLICRIRDNLAILLWVRCKESNIFDLDFEMLSINRVTRQDVHFVVYTE